MALFPVIINERGRWRLAMSITFASGIMVFIGLATIGAGIFTYTRINSYLDLLHNYDGKTLPYMYISVGAILVIFHLIVGKISYDCGHYRTRERWQALVLLTMIILFLFSFVILAAGCLR